MAYICPFCHHQQKIRFYCEECSFDLRSNHLNPYCSKCNQKFTSMTDLKTHFRDCASILKCFSCNIVFNTRAEFDEHQMGCLLSTLSSKESLYSHKSCYLCGSFLSAQRICTDCRYTTEKPLQCPKCNNLSTNLFELKKHFNICKATKKKIPGNLFSCPKCKINFTKKFNRDNHLKKNACTREKYAKCYYENCNVRCYRREGLLKHLKEQHGVEMKYELKKFPSFHDFDLWKDHLGMESLTFFTIQAKSKHVSRSGHPLTAITYGCSSDFHRSLNLRNKLKNKYKRKNRYLVNTSTVCTARIQVKIFHSGQVVAKLCRTHSHAINFDNIQVQILPKSRRDFLSDAFLLGASIEQIMQVIQDEARDLKIVTKETCLTRNFFKECQRRVLYRHTATSDMLAVSHCVDDLLVSNSVLIYKQGEEGYGEIDALDSDTFVIAWQTPEMLKILQSYSQIVYVEGLYHLSHYPNYRLYNFLVVDEKNIVFPVAHYITNKSQADHLSQMFAPLKKRLKDVAVDILIIQSDQELKIALADVVDKESLLLHHWDFQEYFERPRKKMRCQSNDISSSFISTSQDETPVVIVKDELLNKHIVQSSEDCVLQFHRHLRFKLKQCTRLFFMLSVLSNYFKKRFNTKFDLKDDSNIPWILSDMRKKLFQYKCEDVPKDELPQTLQLFNEKGLTYSVSGLSKDDSSDEDLEINSVPIDDNIEENDNFDEFRNDSPFPPNATHSLNKPIGNTSEDQDILKEILTTNAHEDDSVSIHMLKDYQNSIIELLEKNPIARPLIMTSILLETKNMFEQVLSCCEETKNLLTSNNS